MKKTYLILSILFITNVSFAQILDSAYFECLYKLDYTMDLLKPNSKPDEVRLLVGNKYTQFQSYTNYITDSLVNANPEEYKPQVIGSPEQGQAYNIRPASKQAKRSNYKEISIINRSNNKSTAAYELNSRQAIKFEETITNPDWYITTETDSVLGYICQKATTHYAGRDWTAWFAPEIAIGEGPWKLRGLPGLVLKAQDNDKHYVFECIALQRLKIKKPISIDSKYRTVSKADYQKQIKNFFEDPIGTINRQFEGTSAKITIHKTSENADLIRKYNPIELE